MKDTAMQNTRRAKDDGLPANQACHTDEVEAIVHEFQALLVRHETTLEAENLREHMEILQRWTESYRRGLKAAEKITVTGRQWLQEAQEKLLLAADELQRMESEGPSVLPEGQKPQAETLLRAKRRVDALIPAVEHAVAPEQERDKKETALH